MSITRIKSPTPKYPLANGFTLIEVLVSLIIVAIGLLGLAGVHIQGMQGSNGALMRTQATFITNDIATRMRVNKTAMDNNIYALADYNLACAAQARPDCNNIICTSNQIAQMDIADFVCAVEDNLPNANNTSITCADIDINDANPCTTGSPHTISLSWIESLNAPNADTSLADADQVSTITMVVRP